MSENYLEHHGILGQKWGKKNGPPYPLNESDHSAAEKRMAELQDKANRYKSKVPGHYVSDLGKHKAEKYTRKAAAAEGKAYKIRKKIGKTYQKELNLLDNEYVNAAGEYMKADTKANKIAEKASKYIEKHDENPTAKNAEKLASYTDKMKSYKEKAAQSKVTMDQMESYTWQLIGNAAEKGYTVSSTQVIKSSEVGRKALKTSAYLGGVMACAVSSVRINTYYADRYKTTMNNGVTVNQNPLVIQGNKYRVR